MTPTSARGLTLLELLLVVFILATLATLTVSIVDESGNQFRYEDTRTRLENVRRGIVGSPTETINGQPRVGGFVADMGRLPVDLRELIDGNSLPAQQHWQYRAAAGCFAGWQGPYVDPLLENGMPTYRDGWANSHPDNLVDSKLFGWGDFAADQALAEVVMRSLGGDGKSDADTGPLADPYFADYPPGGNSLVKRSDHQVDLSGWRVRVRFPVPPTGVQIHPGGLRLRILYPDFLQDPEDGFDWPETWPSAADRDQTAWLSATGVFEDARPDTDEILADDVVRFDFDAGDAGMWVPWGQRSILLVRDQNGAAIDENIPPTRIVLVPRTALLDYEMTWN